MSARTARKKAAVLPAEQTDVLVIGAGPGGLAVAASLGMRAVRAVVLDKASAVGSSWRAHYDRLHLHTSRRSSFLPGLAIPAEYGDWVARADVVSYLEQYARHHDLDVRTGAEVRDLVRDGDRWALTTTDGRTFRASAVVVATGYNNTPHLPQWPGAEDFTGELIHAARYRNGQPFFQKRVLVVGIGNTGAEISVDLVESGARQVWLAVRTAPHIVRRSNFGWPTCRTGALIRRMPPQMVDVGSKVWSRLETPDLSAYGLPRPRHGLYSKVLAGGIPVMDVGLINAVQRGWVEVVPSIDRFEGAEVVLTDGQRLSPDTVIAATGYRQGLEPLVGHLGVLDERGLPVVHGGRCPEQAPGLYFTGFTNPISGMFRELRIDAEKIATAVSGG